MIVNQRLTKLELPSHLCIPSASTITIQVPCPAPSLAIPALPPPSLPLAPSLSPSLLIGYLPLAVDACQRRGQRAHAAHSG
eukprot:5142314-Pyramimonas_sp.AAC.3